MDFTRPDVSTRASSVTLSPLPGAKYCNMLGEATARTDLISFGGTTPAPSAGGTAETIAALLNDGVADRFPAEAATSGFSGTDPSSATPSGADSTSLDGVSTSAIVEGFIVPGARGCEASSETAPGEFPGVPPVCGDLPESAWPSVLFAGTRGAGCTALLDAAPDEKLFRCGSHGSKF